MLTKLSEKVWVDWDKVVAVSQYPEGNHERYFVYLGNVSEDGVFTFDVDSTEGRAITEHLEEAK